MRFYIAMLAALLGPGTFAAPEVSEILRKLAGNSEQHADSRNAVAYQRISRVEYLDDNGKVKKNTIRVYQVTPVDGEPVTRLISINGRPAGEQEEKKRSAARQAGDKSRTLSLSEDLLGRFEFRFVREDSAASRPCWVLGFVPKPDAPSDGFLDKFINAMSGTLWVDQEDYQLAKAEIHLRERVAFFGGLAGAIDKMNLVLVQRRLAPAVWLGEAVQIDFAGRKLFSDVRFRCFEYCTEFRGLPGLATN